MDIGYQALVLTILGVDGKFPTPEQAFAYLINGAKFETNEGFELFREPESEQMEMVF